MDSAQHRQSAGQRKGAGPPGPVFGVGGNWRDRTANVDSYTGYAVRQGAYAVYNAFAAWKLDRQLTLRVNANNLADKKYISSLYSIGYYGAPRNYSVSLNYTF